MFADVQGRTISYREEGGSTFARVSEFLQGGITCHEILNFIVVVLRTSNIKQTKKLRGFSPQVNYTDRATAACRRS
jgi:hypothetical protein